MTDTFRTPVMVFPPLTKNLRVDVVVIGAGVAGLTAALHLARGGKRVAVIDQAQIASGESGYSTAHLTEFLDVPYRKLVQDLGKAGAELVARATRESIRQIDEISREISEVIGVDTEFKFLPAYTYGEDEKQWDELRMELSAMWETGLVGYWTDEVPVPGHRLSGIELQGQAIVHPRKYLLGMVELLEQEGCHFFENTRAIEIEDGSPCKVVTPSGTIHADDVVVATHSPSGNQLFLQTKVAAYRTYVLALKLANPPPEGLYFDRQDPYHYFRPYGDLWILGGEDHKTGTDNDTTSHFDRLEKYARRFLEVESVEGRWSGQILEPSDGLPYIGKISGTQHLYVATGFSGNGMTSGTLSGQLISDLILSESNPYEKVFRASRMRPFSSLSCYLSENVDFPKYFVKDRINDAEVKSVDDINCGEGKRVKVADKILAVYRDNDTRLHAVSAVCPHAGCYVHFNDAEKTWDCPCHGSRFETNGKVLNGPALADLPKESLARDDPPTAVPMRTPFFLAPPDLL